MGGTPAERLPRSIVRLGEISCWQPQIDEFCMQHRALETGSAVETNEPRSSQKLDLGYFTNADRCPLMVRRGARASFEVFLYLAHRFLEGNGKPVLAEYGELCAACGLLPDAPHSRSSISRLLRSLRKTFGVIEYQPVKRRRPEICLAPARPDGDILNPRHYVYFQEGWSGRRRALFDPLGARAFSAEYMYLIASYESALARVKQNRSYWFFPLEKISATYHVSTRFAAVGLRGLVELGVMRIMHGQYGLRAPNNEFGAANRYYFEGTGEILRRRWQFGELRNGYERQFEPALKLAKGLTNGCTSKNVQGLCALIASYGEPAVQKVIDHVTALPARSLRRRLAYVAALLNGALPVGVCEGF